MSRIPEKYLQRLNHGTACQQTDRRRTASYADMLQESLYQGSFHGSGLDKRPQQAYHFEIVCHTKEQARQLQELLCGFDTDAKIVERKGHYVVYIKEGAHIVDSLNIMEAYVSLMKLEMCAY